MRWQDERYVRVYTRDTPDWIALGWEAQALFMLILRKVDRAGIMELGKQGRRGLTLMFGMPSDVAERALSALLDDGCIELARDRLIVRNFVDAQEAAISDAARKRAQREKDREVARAREDASRVEDNIVSRGVTSGHAASQPVTPSLAVPSDPISTTASPAGAREGRVSHPEPTAAVAQEPAVRSSDAPNHAPAHQSAALPPCRAGNGQSDAVPAPAVAPPAGPDLLSMAAALADAGNGFGRQMVDWAAQGKVFRTNQREKIRQVYAEHVEGQANAARAAALRSDLAPATPRPGHAAAGPEMPIPPGWKPDQASYDLGKTLGFQRGRVDFEAERFVSGSLDKGRRSHNWDQAFANWLRNAKTFDERDGRAPQTPTEAAPKPLEERQLVGLMDRLRSIKPGECVR
jgi:hypothetical protein